MENIDDIDNSNIQHISTELINLHESLTQKSPKMSLKSFVKDVVKRLELVTPISGRVDATGPSWPNIIKHTHTLQCILHYPNTFVR